MSHVDESRLHAFLDGELEAAEEMRIEDHLADCLECAATFDEVVEVHARAGALLESLSADSSAPDYQELVARAAEQDDAGVGGRGFLLPGLAWAATLVLAFFLGWQASERSETGRAPIFAELPAAEAPTPDAPTPEDPAPDDPAPGAEAPAFEAPVQEDAREEAAAGDLAPERATASTQDERAGQAAAADVAEEVEAASPPAEPAMKALAVAPPPESRRGRQTPAVEGDQARMQRVTGAGLAPMLDESAVSQERIPPSSAEQRLGAAALRPVSFDLREVGILPARILGNEPGAGPVLRSVYDLPGGGTFALLQQRRATADDELSSADAGDLEAILQAAPSGVRSDGVTMLQWDDPRGYRVRLDGRLPLERLREIALELTLER